MADVPKYDAYMKPLVAVLRKLGGSAGIDEMYEAVVEEMGLTDEQLEEQFNPDGTSYSVKARLSWSRTYLKKAGFLENSSRGIWSLTQRGLNEDPDPDQVVAEIRSARMSAAEPASESADSATDDPANDWQTEALGVIREIQPAQFERLCQRVLRERGFVEVEVLGRAGDGGIDGRGILRLQGIVSFHVHFQCKRYKGSVGPGEIRDFRGAMVGRSDKGLFITTGTFTRGAQDEATRDGAPPIDLIDGIQFVQQLKELRLGLETKMVESIEIDRGWFDRL